MINIPSTIKISFRSLRVNKMRSGLTMLGIVIGVAAAITMLAVGTGASQRIEEQISSMGSNLLMILPGTTTASIVITAATPITIPSIVSPDRILFTLRDLKEIFIVEGILIIKIIKSFHHKGTKGTKKRKEKGRR